MWNFVEKNHVLWMCRVVALLAGEILPCDVLEDLVAGEGAGRQLDGAGGAGGGLGAGLA